MAVIIRDYVIPFLTLLTFVACVYFTYAIASAGQAAAAIPTALLALVFGYVVFLDAKKLIAKHL